MGQRIVDTEAGRLATPGRATAGTPAAARGSRRVLPAAGELTATPTPAGAEAARARARATRATATTKGEPAQASAPHAAPDITPETFSRVFHATHPESPDPAAPAARAAQPHPPAPVNALAAAAALEPPRVEAAPALSVTQPQARPRGTAPAVEARGASTPPRVASSHDLQAARQESRVAAPAPLLTLWQAPAAQAAPAAGAPAASAAPKGVAATPTPPSSAFGVARGSTPATAAHVKAASAPATDLDAAPPLSPRATARPVEAWAKPAAGSAGVAEGLTRPTQGPAQGPGVARPTNARREAVTTAGDPRLDAARVPGRTTPAAAPAVDTPPGAPRPMTVGHEPARRAMTAPAPPTSDAPTAPAPRPGARLRLEPTPPREPNMPTAPPRLLRDRPLAPPPAAAGTPGASTGASTGNPVPRVPSASSAAPRAEAPVAARATDNRIAPRQAGPARGVETTVGAAPTWRPFDAAAQTPPSTAAGTSAAGRGIPAEAPRAARKSATPPAADPARPVIRDVPREAAPAATPAARAQGAPPAPRSATTPAATATPRAPEALPRSATPTPSPGLAEGGAAPTADPLPRTGHDVGPARATQTEAGAPIPTTHAAIAPQTPRPAVSVAPTPARAAVTPGQAAGTPPAGRARVGEGELNVEPKPGAAHPRAGLDTAPRPEAGRVTSGDPTPGTPAPAVVAQALAAQPLDPRTGRPVRAAESEGAPMRGASNEGGALNAHAATHGLRPREGAATPGRREGHEHDASGRPFGRRLSVEGDAPLVGGQPVAYGPVPTAEPGEPLGPPPSFGGVLDDALGPPPSFELPPADVSTPNPVLPGVVPPETARRVGEKLIAALKAGDRQVELQLDPPHLGRLRVRLQLDGAHVSAQLVTQTEAARELLMNQSAELHKNLAAQGLTLAAFDISLDGQKARTDHEGNMDGGRPGASARGDAAAGPAAPRQEEQPDRVTLGLNRVDLVA